MNKKQFIKILRKLINYYIVKDWFKGKDAMVLMDLIATIEDGDDEEWEKVSKEDPLTK